MQSIATQDYEADIGTLRISFIALDYAKQQCWVINQAGLAQRHAPYSTFKIPHTLIALETGAVQSVVEKMEWDPVKYPAKPFWPETWKQSHNLASAFKASAVWFYQALVPRIEPAEYNKWLARFDYGNQTFTAGSNEFWLDGELLVSPFEQAAFMDCMVQTRCGISSKHFSAFEAAALQEGRGPFSVYAKTGAGPVEPNKFDGPFEGWYVGYVRGEGGKPVAAFALFMQADNFQLLKDSRRALSLRMLSDKGLWADR